MVKRYADLYMEARRALLPTEGDQAAVIAREMLSKFSGKTPAALLADGQLYASEEIEQQLLDGVRRCLSGEPLPYILEEWDFCGMTLHVTKDTLIPRDDTMAVTELALLAAKDMQPSVRILDLCTGTGCIGLALAAQIPGARVTLADISTAALSVARSNVSLLKLGSRVSCLSLDATKQPPAYIGTYDLIVSNPPYITDAEMEVLPASVRNYEPELALRAGSDGLCFYRTISSHYRQALKENGFLCFEFGKGQEDAVGEILTEHGFCVLQYRRDERGVVRAVLAQKKGENDNGN